VQFYPVKDSLQEVSDSHLRGYDQKNAAFWLFKEWEREFDAYVKYGNLPNLQLIRFAHDHFGDFTSAIDGVNTPDKQMAHNDYAVGLLVEKVSKSPYKDSTLIFVIEDDAQDGGDHVDAHLSAAYIIRPYVKQGVVVSWAYNTVSMIRTIEDVLDPEPLGLTAGLAAP
jgi:DNA-binding beta-propeller fold protein YncE